MSKAPFFNEDEFQQLRDSIASEPKPMLMSPNILKAVSAEFTARGLEVPEGLVAAEPVRNDPRKIMIGFTPDYPRASLTPAPLPAGPPTAAAAKA